MRVPYECECEERETDGVELGIFAGCPQASGSIHAVLCTAWGKSEMQCT